MASGGPRNNTDLLKAYGIQINSVPRPRAPPMFLRPPSPLAIERPKPIVPDVSLIIDSASTSIHSVAESLSEEAKDEYFNNLMARLNGSSDRAQVSNPSPSINFQNYYPTPPSLNATPGPGEPSNSQMHPRDRNDSGHGTSAMSSRSNNNNKNPEDNDDTTASEELERDGDFHESSGASSLMRGEVQLLRSDMAAVVKLLNQQQETINKLSSQISELVSSQTEILKKLERNPVMSSKEVQTQAVTDSEIRLKGTQTNQSTPMTTEEDNATGNREVQVRPDQIPSRPKQSLRKSSSSKSLKSSSKSNSSAGKNGNGSDEKEPTAVSSLEERNIEDFSTLLKHLDINDVQGPSMYSEVSAKPMDFPQFNNESCIGSPSIGPSVSACGSPSDDSEDEEVETTPPPPTVTYYNDLLSTVNKFLDKGQAAAENCNMRPSGRPGSDVAATRTTPSTPNNIMVFDHHHHRPPKTYENAYNNAPAPPASSRSSTASYSGSGSDPGVAEKENIFRNQNQAQDGRYYAQPPKPPGSVPFGESNNVVESTKRYLQSIGAQIDSPTPHGDVSPHGGGQGQFGHQQNYMIQQNVYNSIYIPTVKCMPVVSDSFNSNSGLLENLANKYISPSELNQYELLTNKNATVGTTETTVYGMSASNLSFATKQYLQRYGLVGQGGPAQSQPPPPPPVHSVNGNNNNALPITSAPYPYPPKTDRILDITAIRNQPKLL